MLTVGVTERMKHNSMLAYFMNFPEPDLTELNRLADEFEAEMKIEHEKQRQMIREAKARGEI